MYGDVAHLVESLFIPSEADLPHHDLPEHWRMKGVCVYAYVCVCLICRSKFPFSSLVSSPKETQNCNTAVIIVILYSSIDFSSHCLIGQND